MFIWILLGIFCLSFLLAVFSLWKDLRKNIKTEHVSEELSKGRVIFHAPTMSNISVRHENPIPEISKEKIDFSPVDPSPQQLPSSGIITPHILGQDALHNPDANLSEVNNVPVLSDNSDSVLVQSNSTHTQISTQETQDKE